MGLQEEGALTRSAFWSLFMYLCIYTTEEAPVERALVMFFFFSFLLSTDKA